MTLQNFSKWPKNMSRGPDTTFSYFFWKTKILTFFIQKRKSFEFLHWNWKIFNFWLIKKNFDLHWGWKINQILNEKSEILWLLKTSQNDQKTCPGARIRHFLTFLEKQKFWLFSFKSKMFWVFENLKNFSLYIGIWVLINVINHKISIN